MKQPLDELVREAREDFGTREAAGMDWQAVDKGLFARVERDGRTRPLRTRARWRSVAVAGTLAIAAAAIALVVLGSRRGEPVPIAQNPAGNVESPNDFMSIESGGQALVRGITSSDGGRIHVGDVIETQVASVTVQRPGKVTMILEPASRVRVTEIHSTLVLALERGAIEARVAPVAQGEAFAVDVEGSRVAVHGTHLRVQRDEGHVIVDLKEGVIAIGEAPRSGPVLGAVVVAPARAQFMAQDVLGTLTVSREASSLRWPAPSAAPVPSPSLAVAEPRPAVGPSLSHGLPGAFSGDARTDNHGATSAVASSAPGPSAAAETAIASVVRGCMAERPHAENLTILVKTTLYLTLGQDGSVQSARFEPPVAPDVNACAAQSIYRARFEHGGTLTIPIDFKN